MKNAWKILLAALASVFILIPPLALASPLVEDRHYLRLQNPQPTEHADKVEVIEFFWYGCPACNEVEPLIKSWLKKQPADVYFKKVPAIFRDSWAPGARLFYTIEAMNLPRLHDAVFQATHKERINLNDEKILFDWIARQGVDRRKFSDTYQSFAVSAQVRRAADLTRDYGIGGVPAFIVGGKYMPMPKLGTWGETLRVVDGLIEMNRAEIRRKK